jgi:hypothetical protein
LKLNINCLVGWVDGKTTGAPDDTTSAVGCVLEAGTAGASCAAEISGHAENIANDPSNNAQPLNFRFITALSFIPE